MEISESFDTGNPTIKVYEMTDKTFVVFDTHYGARDFQEGVLETAHTLAEALRLAGHYA